MPSGPRPRVPVQQLGRELTSWLCTDTGPCSSRRATSKAQMTPVQSQAPSWFARGGRGNSGGPSGGHWKGPVWQSIRAPPGPGTAGGLLVLHAQAQRGCTQGGWTGLYRPTGAGLGTGLGAGLPARLQGSESLGEVLRVPWRRRSSGRKPGWRRACLVRWSLRVKRLEQSGQGKRFSPVCVRWWRASSSERANFLSHPGQSQAKGRSPAWRTDSGQRVGGEKAVPSDLKGCWSFVSPPPPPQNSFERLNSGCEFKTCKCIKKMTPTHFPNTVIIPSSISYD